MLTGLVVTIDPPVKSGPPMLPVPSMANVPPPV
jgi:hypothetical protein